MSNTGSTTSNFTPAHFGDISQTFGLHMVPIEALVVTTAISATTSTPITNLPGVNTLVAEGQFTYGSGGATVNVYIQTSLDRGATWVDIINFNWTTASAKKISRVTTFQAGSATTAVVPTDGSLTANTIADGILGDQFRVKYVTTGTYAGSSTLQVDLILKS
jgi:hypothetical protein